MQWHLQRKTGEVIRVMDRGVQSITMILKYFTHFTLILNRIYLFLDFLFPSHVLFNILPVIFDTVIAVVFFATSFDARISAILLVTMIGYVG